MKGKVVPTNDKINFSIKTSEREKFITYDSNLPKGLEFALLELAIKSGDNKNFKTFKDGDSFEIELGTCEVKTGLFKREPRNFVKVSRLAEVIKLK